MKKILGLDLGTNSIGWSLISIDNESKAVEIIGMGSRIIPMSQDILGKFDSGVSISQTAERTNFRGIRRLRERHLLRKERLHRVLNILGFLPKHYAEQIDFERNLGQFKNNAEPLIAYDSSRQFIFKKSFEEMLTEFKNSNPELFYIKKNGKETKIPYDWTIYYLRKKAITQRIEKEELAWLILNFNQKRGYYQLREEAEESSPNKKIEFYSLKVINVLADEIQKGKTEIWYNITLENNWVYRRTSKIPLDDWNGKIKEFIVTTELNEDGSEKTDKDGKTKRSFRAPDENDWTLVKKRTEQTIETSGKSVGQFIYDTLHAKPTQKINGKLVRVIERKYYKNELKQILLKQKEFHSEFNDNSLLMLCSEELYQHNDGHKKNITNQDLCNLLLNDIIYYQRPLKSKKSLISDCKFETRTFKNKDGINQKVPIKCIAKSHPLFQEFRLWQWIQNLHIFSIDNDEKSVTNKFLTTEEDYVRLYEFLNDKKQIDQEELIKYLLSSKNLKPKELKIEKEKYRWNYVKDKVYPCNETRSLILNKLSKCQNISPEFLTQEIEEHLWHILYSIQDPIEIESAFRKFALKHKLENGFVEQFKKHPPYKNEYGSYSFKAIRKLLPLMRMGRYWNKNTIHAQILNRIDKITSGEYDTTIKDRVRNKALNLSNINDFRGLPLWLASYIVYDRHSEESNLEQWKTPQELENYLITFKQHSLRNPIVEQVITETLRVVKDIWNHYGNGVENFFSEIHIELGKEMKNPSDVRKKITQKVSENENTNLRIKALLAEMMNDKQVENVRPYSPMQQEILKIYEDGILNSGIEIEDDILKISKTAQPSKSDLLKYKLWLEQKYRSPYTGQVIPLNKLFTPAYEIEHIIPQSRFFDDSLNNKVICETAVNKEKDRMLAHEFILKRHGSKIEVDNNKWITIFNLEQYENFIKNHYSKNYAKAKQLLLEEIPEKMIERQLNDTRYISKEIKNILSKIVRQTQNDEGTTANNLIATNGHITSVLRQDWGLNDIWNSIISPRFERLNLLTRSNQFGDINPNTNKFLPTVPLELSRGFNKKRIDHRHHALDALVIACTTKDHVNLLNNQSAKSEKNRYDLQHKLRNSEKFKNKEGDERIKFTHFKIPCTTFAKDAKDNLETTVISFKQNLRVINKTVNKYQHWKEVNGKMEKHVAVQTKGDSWAIRKPLHKDTVSGKVDLSSIKVAKGKILTATRKTLDTSFDLKSIEGITDTGIQKILKNYLSVKGGNPEIAFSPEGIEEMNNHIIKFNDGKKHKPILKVRVFEQGSKFPIGATGNKSTKYVEGAKGTNLFFAIYQDSDGNRSYSSIPFNEVIESQKLSSSLKQKPQSVPLINEKGHNLLFALSPNDLVYVPTAEEQDNKALVDFNNLNKEQVSRIYKCVSFTGNRLYGIQVYVSKTIIDKVEFSQLNKLESSIEGIQIKSCCWKLEVDRLGNLRTHIKNSNNSYLSSNDPSDNILSEHNTSFKPKRKIHFPDSFDQMELDQLSYFASLTPEKLFQNLKNLSLRAFGFDNENQLNPLKRKLKFDV